MKKLLLLVISFLFIIGGSIPASADTITHNIDEIGISVDMPSDYLSINRNVADNDPALAKIQMTKDTMIPYLEAISSYLCAFPESEEFVINICSIPSTTPEFAFDKVSEQDMQQFYKQSQEAFAQNGLTAENFSSYKHNNNAFIKFSLKQGDTDYTLQHTTTHGSNVISFMLTTHSGQFTDEQRKIIEEIAHSIRYNVPSEPVTTEEPERSLKMKDYILTFAPIVILILVIGGLVLIVKRREKNQKNSGKNTVRVNFENTCTAYERPTLFLRIYVIYLLPLHAVFNVLFIIASIINGHGHSVPAVILSVILQLIIVFCIYFVRKNAMLLNKKGYIFIIAYFALTSVSNCWQEGPDLAKTVVYFVALLLFYIYMNKRKSLFLN